MSEAERPEEAAQRSGETTTPTRSLRNRTEFELLDDQGYDPYNANTPGRAPDVWRHQRKRT
jgi:hypothetical protein